MEDMTDTLARNWWAVALRGLCALLFGVVVFFWPGISLLALVLLFGAYTLLDGVFAIVSAVRAAKRQKRWWLFLLQGIVGIIVGIGAVIWPGITALVLLYVIAAWAIVTGVFEIVAAVHLRKEIEGEWLLALSGIASVIFGVPERRSARRRVDNRRLFDALRDPVNGPGFPPSSAKRAPIARGHRKRLSARVVWAPRCGMVLELYRKLTSSKTRRPR